MRILAIMQNQWLKNAEFHQHRSDTLKADDIVLWWKQRERMLPYALFRGCLSGQRLKETFGELCERITWEEASTIIGSKPSDCPPADIDHIRAILEHHRPEVLILFGSIARGGFKKAKDELPIYLPEKIVNAPHPAARGFETILGLRKACEELREALTIPFYLP